MHQIIQFISEPWVGSILGIIGVALAVIFYLRSKSTSSFSFQFDSTSIVGSANARFPDQLKVLYAGEEVPQVTKERFVFWNSGNTTLSGSQIVASDSLRIELSDEGKMLAAEIVKVTREVNGATCTIPLSAGMVLAGLFRPQINSVWPSFYESKPQDPKTISWYMAFMGLLNLSLPSYIMWSRRRIFPSTLELNSPEENKKA